MSLFYTFRRFQSKSIFSAMNNWALSEISPWLGIRLDSDELFLHLNTIAQDYPWVIIFIIDVLTLNPIQRLSYGRHPIQNIDERIYHFF